MSRRLFDPMLPDKSFPFKMTDKTATDVRATWDRLCPGWRDRKPGEQQRKVSDIKPRLRAKAAA